MEGGIDIDRRDAVTIITIERPHRRNALNGPAWTKLAEVLRAAAASGSVRCLVLTGAAGHFCAGDDLKESTLKEGGAAASHYASTINDCYLALRDAPFPVIASISGACMGAGMSLAMYCDFRLVDRSALLAIPIAKIGDYYPTSLCRRLAALAGASTARRMLMTGDPVDGPSAVTSGIADHLDDDVQSAALALADRLAQRAPLVLEAVKRALEAVVDQESSSTAADQLMELIKGSADREEGRRAFIEKRAPNFQGR